ncbi:putative dehydrogenase [Brevibacterium sanguinis]|uniref:Dehydrogenase n=2 Tax=Brevibacterium TaxID=1696 RepID=A0ABX9GPU0_9MICO|nr:MULTISPECIES: Gfo/Idh/MocA family oxidoreductase [Brevibacterium]RBP65048.1 putative dehydrogenase [Brevibacterium sanguinis]RBP71311.1 putative dehydrogenase [Brevibacterium celere]
MTAATTDGATNTAPIRAAIVGFGTSGRVFHAPLLAADPDFEIAAIVTSDEERRAQAEQAHPSAIIHDSYEALLERIDDDADIDLVVIGTPPALHREQAIAALDRDLSVVVDKPFAPTAEDARQIMEAQAASAGVLSVYQNRRWDSDFATLRALLAEEGLGQVRTFESRVESWSQRPPGGWKDTTPVAEGGGILFDLGTHLLDQAVVLFGPISDVYAELTAHSAEAIADEDSFVSLLHENGVRTRVWMNRRCPAPGDRFRVVGDRAAFVSGARDPQEAQLHAGVGPADDEYGWFDDPQAMQVHVPAQTEGGEADVDTPTAVRGDYPDFYRRMAAAIRGEGEIPVDPYESAQILALIEKIHAEFPLRTRG